MNLSQPTLSQPKPRITSIDFLRGTVMIIMALDHVRDYFHADAFLYDPLDLDKASIPLFFTRWITHFCAPIFVFLAGTSAFLVGQRKTKKELSFFLITRGLWLILLEIVLFDFEWNFDPAYNNIYFIVIWALGFSMICLAGLIHLPKKLILIIGVLLVAGHNLLDNIHVAGNSLKAFGWALLHDQAFFTWQGRNFLVGYPVLPWIGIMALGYCLGSLYTSEFTAERRKKILLGLGAGTLLLFIALRAINQYGDPVPWTSQSSPFYTFLSFIKVNKYPPSLFYSMLTLGSALIFLALSEKVVNGVQRVVSVYGRVPMFYYIIHIFVIHLATLIAAPLFTDFSWKAWILEEPLWFTESLRGYGFSLPVVYLVWIGVVAGIYPLCKWYDGYKSRNKHKWWLSYL